MLRYTYVANLVFGVFVVSNIFLFFLIWSDSPQWARASSFTRVLDHTQQSVGLLWTSD